jgi:hypothetical protein
MGRAGVNVGQIDVNANGPAMIGPGRSNLVVDATTRVGCTTTGVDITGLLRANTSQALATATTGIVAFTSATANNGAVAFESTCTGTANRFHFSFVNPNGVVGWILTNASTTSFVSLSDYRLKENVVSLTGGIARLNQLPVRRFNFITDPDTMFDGFLAHEVQDIVPEAVTGEKDEVDDDDNPVYQGIDQSKLVPLLTAALQEAIAKIEALETRMAALEA